jgi:hypothetical protein
MISFDAEVIKVEVKKTVSLDREFKIILITDNPDTLELAQFVNEKTVKVSVSPNV